MQDSDTPPEVNFTSENCKKMQEDIVGLIESVTAPHTVTEVDKRAGYFTDFSMRIWIIFPLIAVIAMYFISIETDYAWTIKMLRFALGISFLVIMVLIILISGLRLAHKVTFRFRRSNPAVTNVRNTKISDEDLELLAANRFIKVWLLEALGKYDTLTYFILHKDRYKISHKAHAEVVVAEKKRIRALIGG